MKYRLSSHDRFLGGALLYRGWGFGGYDLGDRMVFLAGSSLGVEKHSIRSSPGSTSRFATFVNFHRTKMGEAEEGSGPSWPVSSPRFAPGSCEESPALHLFSRWVEQNDVPIPFPEAVFTSAEPPLSAHAAEHRRCLQLRGVQHVQA